jgi:hypothetical protein
MFSDRLLTRIETGSIGLASYETIVLLGGIAAAAAPTVGLGVSVGTSIAGAVQGQKTASQQRKVLDAGLTEQRRASLLAARLESGRSSRGEMGLNSTTLTGKQGDLSVAPVGKRTLLGG